MVGKEKELRFLMIRSSKIVIILSKNVYAIDKKNRNEIIKS